MTQHVWTAFVREFEKLAAGPRVFVDHDGRVMRHIFSNAPGAERTSGVYLSPENIAHLPRHLKRRVPEGGAAVVVQSPRLIAKQQTLLPHMAEDIEKLVRRHEMTHWARARSGKLNMQHPPGLRALAHIFKEEVAANLATRKVPVKTFVGRRQQRRFVYGAPLYAAQSTAGNLEAMGGLRGALSKGSLGKAVRRVLTKGAAVKHEPISAADRKAWNARKAMAGMGSGDGCSLGRDKQGFYCYTHRSRSSSYPTPQAIPLAAIKFTGSTS